VTSPTPRELLATAEAAARAGGALLAERFFGARTIDFKEGERSNLVTDADTASEQRILGLLRAAHPSHAILAEESGASEGDGYTWFVDPLDGTTNYAHQVPHFCVTLAVEGPAEDGSPQLLAGVVFDPMRNELFAAARGHGATLNGHALVPSRSTSLRSSLLCTGFPYDLHLKPELPLGLFNTLVQKAQGIRRMGSAALDLAYVAAGRFDGFFEFGLKPWDIAAGALLIQEAGARMVRIDGAPLDVRRGDVLAAAPGVFPQMAQHTGDFLRDIGWVPRAPHR
jgi:myo-inositol-1(or 4)-monophosphatase